MTKAELTLPSNRAFVVQFRTATCQTHAQYAGRIEHLVSGQATHFESWEQLQRSIEQMLMQVSEKPP
ncbi:MAG TPA: hypothetical protein VKJ47_00850 [Candidatus Binatia bacterium]|nr:hypothetical protein [Candidatus Binatia bacterium]